MNVDVDEEGNICCCCMILWMGLLQYFLLKSVWRIDLLHHIFAISSLYDTLGREWLYGLLLLS